MNRLRHHLLPLLAYVALAVVMTWPVAARLTTEFAGGRGDLWVHTWTFWWVREALRTGQNVFYTTQLYYPDGAPLVSHNIAWLNIAAWLPLQAVFGRIAAYNLTFIGTYALNGYALYLLARALRERTAVAGRAAAFLAGAVFAFWPYTLSHYDHPNMILLFAVPLALLALKRVADRPTWGRAALLAGAVALVGFSRWQHLAMGSLLIGGYAAHLLWRTEPTRRAVVFGRMAAAAAGALVLMVPLAIPLIQSQLGPNPRAIAIEEINSGRTDLMAYVVQPDLYRRLWGDAVLAANPTYSDAYHQIAASTHYVPYVGVAALALALLGAVANWRHARFWLLLAGFYIVFALGPELAVNGRPTGIPLPYRLIEPTPLGEFIRRPHRLNVMLGLPIALLAGWGTAAALNAARRVREYPAARWALTGLLLLPLLVEVRLTTPLVTTPLTVPSWYATVAGADPTAFGLLEIPFDDRSFDKEYMAYQTVHGVPIATGHISRLPAEAWTALDRLPWLATVGERENEADYQPDFTFTDVGRILHDLDSRGIRYVVLHRAAIADGVLLMWQDWFTIAPTHSDADVLVYDTALTAGEDFVLAQPLADGIGLIRHTVVQPAAVQGGRIRVDTRWATTAPLSVDYAVCFALAGAARTHPLGCRPLDAAGGTVGWPAPNVVRAYDLLPVPDDVPPGDYVLTIALRAGDALLPGHALGSIAVLDAAPPTDAPLTWENGLTLAGYRIDLADGGLVLAADWQTAAPQSTSYTRFVHLIDPATGAIVAQSDGIPANWLLPTDAWEVDERVRDVVKVPLDGVPAGAYELWLGWYDGVTGVRVRSADGADRVMLGRVDVP